MTALSVNSSGAPYWYATFANARYDRGPAIIPHMIHYLTFAVMTVSMGACVGYYLIRYIRADNAVLAQYDEAIDRLFPPDTTPQEPTRDLTDIITLASGPSCSVRYDGDSCTAAGEMRLVWRDRIIVLDLDETGHVVANVFVEGTEIAYGEFQLPEHLTFLQTMQNLDQIAHQIVGLPRSVSH